MRKNTIYISVSPDAIDISLITKDTALLKFASANHIPKKHIAAIGYGMNDLPFLTVKGLGLIGTPANAQEEVIRCVSEARNGKVCKQAYFKGFSEFYDCATKLGISVIFTDKDGVLISKKDKSRISELADLLMKAGTNHLPAVHILTGSGVEQNHDFIKSIKKHAGLARNPYILTDPYIIHAENGAIDINILTGEWRYTPHIEKYKDYADYIATSFKDSLMIELERFVLHKYKLQWSYDSKDRDGKIYLPNKRTMITFDLPKSLYGIIDINGSLAYNIKQLCNEDIIPEIKNLASFRGLPYKILS